MLYKESIKIRQKQRKQLMRRRLEGTGAEQSVAKRLARKERIRTGPNQQRDEEHKLRLAF